MQRWFAIALICVLTLSVLPGSRAADDPSPEPPADVTCRLDSGAGAFTASSGPKETLVRIASAGYQGNASISFKTATPARLKFQFAGLRGMQTFTLGDGKHSFQGSLGWGGRTSTYWDKTGRQVTNPALAAVTMIMEASKAGDIVVSITARGVELGKELKINWLMNGLKERAGFQDS